MKNDFDLILIGMVYIMVMAFLYAMGFFFIGYAIGEVINKCIQ